MSINRQLINVIYSYNETLFCSHENEQTTAAHHMGETQKCNNGQKIQTKNVYTILFHLYKIEKQAKLIY